VHPPVSWHLARAAFETDGSHCKGSWCGRLTSAGAASQAVGDDLVDSIISDNIPVLTEQEKFNETAVSSVQRLAAKLRGQPVPAAPQRADSARQRTYKTKARSSSLSSRRFWYHTFAAVRCRLPL